MIESSQPERPSPAGVGGWLLLLCRLLVVFHPLSLAVAAAAGNTEIIGVAYWMDMALLNAAGIPCVAYGPSGEGEHADVEWVDIASVERCIEVYMRAAELLCN